MTFNNPTITTDDRSKIHIDVSANGWNTTLGLTATDSHGGEITIQLTLAEAYLLGTLITHGAERHDYLNPRPRYYD